MRNVAFTPIAFQEYNEWFENNDQLASRIKALIRDIDRDPFKVLAKLTIKRNVILGHDATGHHLFRP